jgi:hypothetical protein
MTALARNIGLTEHTSEAIFRRAVKRRANSNGPTRPVTKETSDSINYKEKVNLPGKTTASTKVSGKIT